MNLKTFFVALLWLIVISLNNYAVESRPVPQSETSYVETSSGVYIFARTYNMHHYYNSKVNKRAPLLFIHGLFLSEQMWSVIIEYIYAKSSRKMNLRSIIAIDLRGHGESQVFPYDAEFSMDVYAQDIIQVLDYYNITQAVWCGYSLGGLVALHGAINYPSYVEKLAIISSGPRLNPIIDISGLVSFTSLSRTLLLYTVFEIVLNFLDYSSEGYMSLDLAIRLLSDKYKVTYEALQGALLSLITADYNGNTVTKSSFIAWGVSDEFFNNETQYELKIILSNYVYHEYNINHGLPFVNVSTLVDSLFSWL